VEPCLGDPSSGSSLVATGYDFEYQTCSNSFEIRRANDCALQYLSPQPVSDSLGVIYPPQYIPFQFNELRGPTGWARNFIQGGKARTILKLAGPNGKILDVGSGSGVLIRQVARVKGSRENLWANDFSEEVVAPLRREGFQILVGLAEELDTPDRFDVITLNQVIEHLPNPNISFSKLPRLMGWMREFSAGATGADITSRGISGCSMNRVSDSYSKGRACASSNSVICAARYSGFNHSTIFCWTMDGFGSLVWSPRKTRCCWLLLQ